MQNCLGMGGGALLELPRQGTDEPVTAFREAGCGFSLRAGGRWKEKQPG